MKAMVLAQTANGMRALCGIARGAADEVEAIALGAQLRDAAVADTVWYVADQAEVAFDDYADTVIALVTEKAPALVLVEQTIALRQMAGRLGAALGTSAMDSVFEFAADATVKHLVYGGTAVCTERVVTPTALLLIDPNQYDAAEPAGANAVEEVAFVAPAHPVRVVSEAAKESAGCDLGGAARVVGIGRGIAQEADLEMVRAFASALGAEIGCTRPVAEEEKWLPRETYIGVSGITLSPDVYVAVGLSGQVQHTVGINRSKAIVAINKDKNAIIFKQCDLGIVGDLYKVLPAVTAALA